MITVDSCCIARGLFQFHTCYLLVCVGALYVMLYVNTTNHAGSTPNLRLGGGGERGK